MSEPIEMQTCGRCGGAGYLWPSYDLAHFGLVKCPACNGTGRVEQARAAKRGAGIPTLLEETSE